MTNQSRAQRITSNPLFPVPKVYIPFLSGLIAVASQVVATGQFDRTQLAQLVIVGGWAILGYAAPPK